MDEMMEEATMKRTIVAGMAELDRAAHIPVIHPSILHQFPVYTIA